MRAASLIWAAVAAWSPAMAATCSGPTASNPPPQQWWRAVADHNGTTPHSADATFQHYRNVVAYGADATGAEDSSQAFNDAVVAWNRTANTVTTLPAYVYVPPGRYRIRKPIQLLVNTFLVGDALDPPTLLADAALDASPVVRGYDAHQGEGSANKNFYMALRNFFIDTTAIAPVVYARALDWSVSQGCSLTNVHVVMPPASNHTGITMENGGSGNVISDCSFKGGAVGIELFNQQYLLKGLTFDGCATAIYVKTAYVVTVQGCAFSNCLYGVDMARTNGTASAASDGVVGAVSVVDSSATNCAAGVNVLVSAQGQGGASLVLDNFAVSNATAVRSSTGSTLLAGAVAAGQAWVMGNTNPGDYQSGQTYTINQPASLVANGKYFTAPLPQYEKYGADQVVNVMADAQFRVYGDNSHDDGPAINAILAKAAAACHIVFFPQGIYRTNSTIEVPAGSRLVGDVLSVISGAGANFSDGDNPRPIIRVGQPGDRGVAQLTDFLVTVADVLPGAVAVQVNMAGATPGDVGLWNCVVRVGGALDSLVGSTDKCAGPDPASCKAAFALLHVGRTASAYFEGFWGWVADHNLDDPSTAQNIAVGRGVLVESSPGPVWLVGTSFEHTTLYQYGFHNSANVLAAGLQTEPPYWQGANTPQRAPAPFSPFPSSSPSPSPWTNDPTFANCAAQNARDNAQCFRAWALHALNTSTTTVHGAAMWAFFNGMADNGWRDAACAATAGVCQLNAAYVGGLGSKDLYWFSLATKATANVVYDDAGGGAGVATAQDANRGAWGGLVAAYLRDAAGAGAGIKCNE
ncbi:pectate lyase superfamily protein-domain-containing protein [Lasiosphaeria ovina]|uniref:Pectate lyase superfamily protein-domain-containing protein n=1 Tax=Lasiosphaeria ovina TaxID=92902 RepID=A0AAE0KCB4_9PEZI|nr:pectate lyase superfamily protein-domain-containing protein [Lasiosphaeria ovina]